MKIGRNSPCPCGSGKKFKHCCGVEQQEPQHWANAPNVFDIVRRAAYAGALGSARKDFSRNALKEKQRIFAIIKQNQETDADHQGLSIECVPGCSFCCYHFIGGSLQECESIVYFLYSHKNKLKHFLDQYPVWRRKTREHESLFRSLGFSYSNVPLMVYEILKGGVWYLARLPGLQGIDRKMFKDPRAAGLIRSVRTPRS